MKNLICMFVSMIFVSACVPEVDVNAPEKNVDQKFNIENYVDDQASDLDLEGLWVLTSTDYNLTVENSDGTSFVQSGYTRMLCEISISTDPAIDYMSSCPNASEIIVADNNAVSSDGVWVASIVDNTHLTGSINHIVYDNGNTSTRALSFDMVKIADLDMVSGTLSIHFDAIEDSINLVSFMELDAVNISYQDSVEVNRDSVYMVSAYNDEYYLWATTSQQSGDMMFIETSSLFIESDSFVFSDIINDINSVTFNFSGENVIADAQGNKTFTGSLSVSFESTLENK